MVPDYSLYLVTDSTAAILGDRDLVEVVRAAVEGGTLAPFPASGLHFSAFRLTYQGTGVSIVQYRDKTSETADLVRIGKALHEVTQKGNVPLLINDRVDVALAVGAEGVHLGQEDLDIANARKLLGPDTIIGVTVSTVQEARIATEGGANYLGIGTMFATPTKENTKAIIGTAGTREILNALSAMDEKVATVSIGGINSTNVQRVLYQTKASFKALDGVAVVSAIVGAQDPKQAASELRTLIRTPPPFGSVTNPAKKPREVQHLLDRVPTIVKKLGRETPLCHNMTNLVVQNFAANVALCIGASPIMANYGAEARDLAALDGSLVINMGTVTPDGLTNYQQALRAYNARGGPVLLDPVGAGATQLRRDAVKTLMAGGFFDVIKGNEGEIKTVAGESGVQQRGVDSGASTLSETDRARLVKKLAARERNVVLMSGVVDYLSDGERTYAISNGHEYLGLITGSGCTLGTTIAAFLAVHHDDKLLAALAGILLYEIAAQHAALRDDVKGPGTFVPAFLDELYDISRQAAQGKNGWLSAARVKDMDV